MAKKKKIDFILVCIVLALLLVGLLILYSVSAPISKEKFGHTYYYLKHQFLFGILPGLIGGAIAFKINLKKLKKLSLYLLLLNLILSVAVFFPIVGLEIGGARRWIKMGPVSFQPAEFLKITLPLYLGVWLEKQKRKKMLVLAFFLLVLVPPTIIMVLQPDVSTLLLIVTLCFIVYFMSGAPLFHFIILGGIGLAGLLLLIHFTPYRLARLLVFIDPKIDPMGMGYQIKQSLIAIGSGGLWGKGFGLSKQKFGYLPNVISDSIFPAFCEEAGFVGAFLLVFLFLLFITRVLVSARQVKNEFSRIMACSLASGITLQAFLNMGAMSGLLPLTGVPLPFLSYGGTHLLTELVTCGLILNFLRN